MKGARTFVLFEVQTLSPVEKTFLHRVQEHTDWEQHMDSVIIKSLCKDLEIQKTRTTPYLT